MGTALSVALVVLEYAASFAFLAAYVVGSIGLVRAASRTVRQGGAGGRVRTADLGPR